MNNKLKNDSSDKTVRLFRWEVGKGFTEDANSPFVGHKYAVTRAVFSPKVGLKINVKITLITYIVEHRLTFMRI